MNSQQLEQQFIGKLFSYKGINYFCKDVSVNETTISITTDKKAIKVAKTAWNLFLKDVIFNTGNPNHIELSRKKIKLVIKSDLKNYIGKITRNKRLELGYTMEELGELSGKGKKFVWQLEKGITNFRIDDIELLLNLLNLDFQTLIVTKYLTENANNDY
jgi:hypothetical protein